MGRVALRGGAPIEQRHATWRIAVDEDVARVNVAVHTSIRGHRERGRPGSGPASLTPPPRDMVSRTYASGHACTRRNRMPDLHGQRLLCLKSTWAYIAAVRRALSLALYARQPADDVNNYLKPWSEILQDHGYPPDEATAAVLTVLPDILRYDMTRPAAYPNGRLLTDDPFSAAMAFLTHGKVTSSGLRPHDDLRAQFPFLGLPNPLPAV